MTLQDKVAVITGASRGIGAATAQLFAQEGAKVVLNYHVSDYESAALENVTAVVQTITNAGGEATAIAADVADEQQVEQLLAAAIEHYGQIDILVNNAGIVYDVPIDDRTAEQWQATFNTNVLGVYNASKQALHHMKQRQTGKIINLSSTSGIDAFNPESIDYDATKASTVALTKNFARLMAPFGTANAVAPGWVNTDMNKDLPSEFVAAETAKIYLGRFAEAKEIATIILFLASDAGNYVNGSVIIADGGRGH